MYSTPLQLCGNSRSRVWIEVEVRAKTGLICRLAAEHWPSQHLDPKPPVCAPIPIMTQLGPWAQNDRLGTNICLTSFQSQRKPSPCNQLVQTVDTLARGTVSQIMEQSDTAALSAPSCCPPSSLSTSVRPSSVEHRIGTNGPCHFYDLTQHIIAKEK